MPQTSAEPFHQGALIADVIGIEGEAAAVAGVVVVMMVVIGRGREGAGPVVLALWLMVARHLRLCRRRDGVGPWLMVVW